VFSPADPVGYLQDFEVVAQGLDLRALAKKNQAWASRNAKRVVCERAA
jgi:hypothetical protein